MWSGRVYDHLFPNWCIPKSFANYAGPCIETDSIGNAVLLCTGQGDLPSIPDRIQKTEYTSTGCSQNLFPVGIP